MNLKDTSTLTYFVVFPVLDAISKEGETQRGKESIGNNNTVVC